MFLEDDSESLEDEEIIHEIVTKNVAKNINNANDNLMTFGDKFADKIAEFAGSWTFIISFISILFLWILVNVLFMRHPYDPYPFILLNLVLSCIAAIQAPVIMMSQNRQEKKDRMRAQNDYKINLKSEIIVEDLHQKLDILINNQEQIMKRLDILEKKNKQN